MLYEGVVLFGSTLGKRLEPVGVVGHSVLLCPQHNTGSYSVCHLAVETHTVLNDVHHLLVYVLGKILVHLLTVENLLTEILSWSLTRYCYVKRLLLESLFYDLESQIVCHVCVCLNVI